MLWLPTVFALMACTPTASDADNAPDEDTTIEDVPADPTWNVLVYVAGDNDLENLIFHDLNELEAGGSDDAVRVWALVDRSPGYDDGWGDWTGTRLYRIIPDDDPDAVVSPWEDVGERDTGDPSTLADFLALVRDERPADRTLLSIWNHGDGWYFTPPAPTAPFASDDTSGSGISIAEGELAEALEAQVDAEGSVDVLAFDACYMASWEVAHSLRGHAEFLVGSEAIVDVEGLRYTPLLTLLRSDPSIATRDVALRMAEDAVAEDLEYSFSATDIAKVDALAAAIDALAGWGLSGAAASAELADAIDEARGADEEWAKWYLDLRDLANLAAASSDPTGARAGDAVLEAMDAAVIANHTTGLYEGIGGLSIFADVSDPEWTEYYRDAPGATWSAATRWDDFIHSIAAPANNSAR